MAAFIGALKSVEAVILFPSGGVVAAFFIAWVLTAKFWLAAAGVGVLVVAGRIVRLFGPPRPIEPPAPELQGEARTRDVGFNLVAGWIGFGILAMIVMFDTRSGPFAWFAGKLLGWDAAVPFATLLLGPIAIAMPLVFIAVLPRQDRWPVFAAMQDRVQPTPKRHRRPK